MRAVVVYESIFGNTREIALAIGAGIRSHAGIDVDVVEVGEAPSPEGYDVVVVGGPIHAWGMTRPATRQGAAEQARQVDKEPVSKGIGVREWLAQLLPVGEPRTAAAFDTAVKTRWFPVGSAAKGAARQLAHAGYRVIAEPEHFLVEDTQGPLVDGELKRAIEWGATLAAAASR